MIRSEAEVRENLEWLKSQCVHFKEDEGDRVVRQLEVLLWVLGHERAEAAAIAEMIWLGARSIRHDSPRGYS
jgi:hypothetical protein